ncbi:MAG: trehalose-phosphatase [Myxococcota bacterium]
MTPPPDLEALAERIARLDRPTLVALDVDGTLAPIVDDPAAARVPDGTRALLERIGAVPKVHVALVTGRDGESLHVVAGGLRVWRAVSHGRVVLGPSEQPRGMALSEAAEGRLEAFRAWAEAEAVPRGARIEDKDGAVAVHVRALSQSDPAEAEAVLEQARGRAEREGLHPRLGRAVCEAEIEPGDKATALDKLMRATAAVGVVYAGDDLTDFPAIRLAVERGGLGLFVASGERQPPPEATATLRGPQGLVALLRALLDRIEGASGR